MIVAVHTCPSRRARLTHRLRALPGLRRAADADREVQVPSAETALVRALCHDMGGSLRFLEVALARLREDGAGAAELLELAQAQTAYLSSMLRTADVTAGEVTRHGGGRRLLGDVVAAAAAASGLPRAQLVVEFGPRAGEVVVGDARLQRILGNLLENAHRHGAGAPVGLTVTCRPGWVELALRQASTCCGAVIDHLHRSAPPVDLTGLGLWSVQRQARELGGLVDAEDDGATLTLRVLLPDH